MKIESLAFILAAMLLTSSAYAQDANAVPASPTRIATPSSPAPVIVTNQSQAPNQIIYTPQLPTVADLTNAAAARGLTIDRIEQTSTQILVVYKYANGQTNVVSYQTLPPSTGATAATTTPQTTVIYESSPRVIYYHDPFYDPFWYSPFSVHVGLGFGYRYRGGYGYGGGFHHSGFHHGR